MKLIQALPLLATIVLAACTTGTPGPTRTSASNPTGSPFASPDSRESRGPTVAPPTAPSSTAPATPTPIATVDVPPQGALGYSDLADVGWLGSYCWHGTCADVVAIPPKAQLPEILVQGDTLIFSLVDGEFTRWIAQYGSDDSSLMTFAEGGESFDPDAATPGPDTLLEWVEFDAPPPGDWVVRVQTFFVDGDASYYWHVIVP